VGRFRPHPIKFCIESSADLLQYCLSFVVIRAIGRGRRGVEIVGPIQRCYKSKFALISRANLDFGLHSEDRMLGAVRKSVTDVTGTRTKGLWKTSL
jgi:hypothetical protein